MKTSYFFFFSFAVLYFNFSCKSFFFLNICSRITFNAAVKTKIRGFIYIYWLYFYRCLFLIIIEKILHLVVCKCACVCVGRGRVFPIEISYSSPQCKMNKNPVPDVWRVTCSNAMKESYV